MRTKELMVGDWVYNKHHQKNIKITPYDFFNHTHNKYGEQELTAYAKPTFGNDLEPIPLTKEILEHNGFKWLIMDQTSVTYCIDDPAIHASLIKNTNEWLISIGGAGSVKKRFVEVSCIRYVYELQHALRLCGIEKEIEL